MRQSARQNIFRYCSITNVTILPAHDSTTHRHHYIYRRLILVITITCKQSEVHVKTFSVMDFTKIIVLLTLLNIASSSDPDKGYLLLNGSIPTKGCYNLPSNTQCPFNLIDYKVFGSGYADNFSKLNLKSVDLMIMSLKFFKEVTPACEDAVREYACSNTFARCEKDDSQTLGAVVAFNVTRTTQACAKVKKSCPFSVQAETVNNCTTIMSNFTDLIYCVDIPNIPGDICPKSNYKVNLLSPTFGVTNKQKVL